MNQSLYQEMSGLVAPYEPISLERMTKIKLMNRIDTKYVVPVSRLRTFLELAADEYYVQEIEGERLAEYRTTYLDTTRLTMFQVHACGHATRRKVRVRTYVGSGLTFLEVKLKNNRGRTDKRRISIDSHCLPDTAFAEAFLTSTSGYAPAQLHDSLSNTFRRITLVNKDMTERLTIDLGIQFTNHATGATRTLARTAIVEVKRDGLTYSPATSLLRQLRLVPSGFSKYCMGMAMTDPSLRAGRLKMRLMKVNSIEDGRRV